MKTNTFVFHVDRSSQRERAAASPLDVNKAALPEYYDIPQSITSETAARNYVKQQLSKHLDCTLTLYRRVMVYEPATHVETRPDGEDN